MATRERFEADPLDRNPDSLTAMLNQVERSTNRAENNKGLAEDYSRLLEQRHAMPKPIYIAKLEEVIQCLIERALQQAALHQEAADETRAEIDRRLGSQLDIPSGEIGGDIEEA